jgi:hypothetical protein
MLTAAAMVGAGCGGGADDTTKVKRTMTRFLSSLGAGDAATACALLAPSGRAGYERLMRAPAGSCSLLVTLLNRRLPPQVKTALRHAQIKRVRIKGKTATVRHADVTSARGDLSSILPPHSPPTVLMKQRDGTWKIAG